MTASSLQQLLALYFAIIYSWQLSSSDTSLVGEKIHPYISRILKISFSLRNVCLPCQLRNAYSVLLAANHFVGSETPKRNDFNHF